jgi:hypothetical protein
MAYANLYRKYIKKQVPAVKTSLKTRNIYKIESYEYVDGTKKTFRGPDASLVFLVGISPDRKLSVIKFSEVVPDRFFRWLKTMFRSSITCKQIKEAIGSEEFETLLLSDTKKGGATFSKLKTDGLYKTDPSAFRTYTMKGIKSISCLYLDDDYIITKLLKLKCFDDADLNQDGIVTEEEIQIYEKRTGEKYKPSI